MRLTLQLLQARATRLRCSGATFFLRGLTGKRKLGSSAPELLDDLGMSEASVSVWCCCHPSVPSGARLGFWKEEGKRRKGRREVSVGEGR